MFIKMLDGKTTCFQASSSYSIYFLKLFIQQIAGIPIFEQRLIFSRWQLEGNRTFADYKMQRECTVHLMLR